jgi:enamine deaminase RidA (YjgF/YER057c/UK114 family)
MQCLATTVIADMTPEQRLEELGLSLPSAREGIGNYAPWAKTGNLVMTSGQFPWRGETLAYTGQIGAEHDEDAGYQSARLSALNAIAQLRSAAGGRLDRVKQIVRLEGHLYCVPGFSRHAQVINGASDLFNAVFPQLPPHSRAVHGAQAMPLGTTTLLYVYAELQPE